MVSNLYDIKSTIFMVKGSFEAKPLRTTIINTYGGTVYASPSEYTEFGKKVLKEHPDTSGSLGIASAKHARWQRRMTEMLRARKRHEAHVMLHQTVIGLELQKQLEAGEIEPDCLIACVGGGSNFGGFTFPFIGDRLRGKKSDCEIIAVEPKAAPSLTEGDFRYDYGDTAGMTPLLMMYTLGSSYIPPSIHAGGLRYHGMAPLVSAAYDQGFVKAVSYDQTETFAAGVLMARTEGIIPAPESCHALKAAIDKALECKKTGEAKNIVFNLSGHGLLDLYGYEQYLNGPSLIGPLKQYTDGRKAVGN